MGRNDCMMEPCVLFVNWQKRAARNGLLVMMAIQGTAGLSFFLPAPQFFVR